MSVEWLRGVPLFAKLGRKDLEVMARLADQVDVKEGRVLIRQGDLGREFFIIQSGTAEVTRDGVTVNSMGPGDFFGEIALVEQVRRTATVTATSPMSLIVMTGAKFRSLQQTMPELYATVKAEIAKPRAVPA